LVGNELESECVQQYKESENCEYENNEENEEGFESGERTLPLCFSSFKSLSKSFLIRNPLGMMLNIQNTVGLQMKTTFPYVFLPLNC
jgi:hypothetical protein